MKKALSLILALVLCLSLCACGGSNDVPETEVPNTTEMTNAQTEQTQPKEMTVMDAERIGKEYLDSAFGRMRSLSSVKNSVKNADSFSSFSINKSTTEQDGRYYYCTFKGTFYAKDEYGKNLGQYRFTWTAKISMDDWAACMSDDISISK